MAPAEKARPSPASGSTADLRRLRPADQRGSALRSQRKSAVNLLRGFCQASLVLPRPSPAFSGQQKQNNADEVVKLGAELVLLDADIVSKKTGQAVDGLKAQDFVVYEDGVKQAITHFSQDRLPLSVLILLDVSGSVWPTIKALRGRRA